MTEEQTVDNKKPSLLDGWNAAPNLVTYSRIVLVVVFLALYVAAGPWGADDLRLRWIAAVIFIDTFIPLTTTTQSPPPTTARSYSASAPPR